METILIVDFGSQYNLLIARRIREHGVYCEVVSPQGVQKFLRDNAKAGQLKGIILSGGPSSIYDAHAPKLQDHVLKTGVPLLGICYGMQIICHKMGGRVKRSRRREYGRATFRLRRKSAFFKGVKTKTQVWMSHGDSVSKLPPGFVAVGATSNTPRAAIEESKSRIYGVQFHPEVMHTLEGSRMLKNFVFGICKCKGDWNLGSFVKRSIQQARAKVGRHHVILGLSGGVDSSVVAALLSRALGKRLTCIFVDNGLIRKGEWQQVQKTFGKRFKLSLHCLDKKATFLKALKGVVDPEAKRKIIGHEFVHAFQAEARRIKNADFLAQGTLYPDVIESQSAFGGPSATIKTHHNVGGLPPGMKLKLIEPLRELFKDEVRQVGRRLGLPKEMVERHPFPGPGLAVRILGEVTADRLKILKDADFIFIEALRQFRLYDKVWQAFCVLLPVKTVGVMGDKRTYENVLALRAVTSHDGMTADWARLPSDFLAHVSNRIINEVPGVNRVVYDVSSKPPATIEWE